MSEQWIMKHQSPRQGRWHVAIKVPRNQGGRSVAELGRRGKQDKLRESGRNLNPQK